jgi:V-type H+-transporting ATPase subunit C
VESILRYGLPAEYMGIVIKVHMSIPSYRLTFITHLPQPDPKNVKKLFNVLQTQFASLRPKSNASQGGKIGAEDFIGEYQTLMDQDFFDFILYEVPWIIT